MKILFVLSFIAFFSINAYAQAPQSFPYHASKAVFINMSEVRIKYTYDVRKKKVFAKSKVKFKCIESGYPLLDLVPGANVVELDGEPVIGGLVEIQDPDSATTMRVLEKNVEKNIEHELYVEFEMNRNLIFGDNFVRSAFAMSDLSDRQYFEKYGPANLEFDSIHYIFDVEVVGTSTSHVVMHNGTAIEKGTNSWTIDFPAHFNASSLYFHLFEVGAFEIVNDSMQLNDKKIDLIFYARSRSDAEDGLIQAKKNLEEFNALFGPYCYSKFVGLITGEDNGGMEYGGATMSSIWALRHEINHSWFARCIQPANGNAGWMDEAIAVWSDNNFETATGVPKREEVNLANFSQYQRKTPMESYEEGEMFISELDYLLANVGGMKKLLAEYFQVKKFKITNTPFFQNFLEQKSKRSLNEYFKKYVYGKENFKFVEQKLKVIKNRKTGVVYHREMSAQDLRNQL